MPIVLVQLGDGFRRLIGRYPPIIFMMAVAGSVAAKPTIAVTTGTLRTDPDYLPCYGWASSLSSAR